MRSDLKRSGLREVWGRRSALRKRQYSPAYKQDSVSSVTASDWSSWSNPSSGTFPSKTEIITEKRKMKGNILWLHFWICHCRLLQCMATFHPITSSCYYSLTNVCCWEEKMTRSNRMNFRLWQQAFWFFYSSTSACNSSMWYSQDCSNRVMSGEPKMKILG